MAAAARDDLDFILQRDWRAQVVPRFGMDPWLTVHEDRGNDGGIYCALVPSDGVELALATHEPDLSRHDWLPQVWKTKAGHEYMRFGADDGLEPLVHARSHDGIRPKYLELAEEYRHFHSLFHEVAKGEFIKILDDGTEDVVGRITPQRCDLRLREVRQFLAIKRMNLLLWFWNWRESSILLTSLPSTELGGRYKDALTNYVYEVFEGQRSSEPTVRTISRLVGRKLVQPLALERCGVWPYEDEKTYQSFVIGTDADGRDIDHSCDPDCLADAFGSNPGAPIDLTPVFFRKQVLDKYFATPSKYEVKDGLLRCAGLWSVQIDNNHQDYVVVFLKDLGRDLPRAEQDHWRRYNVQPDGSGISDVSLGRSIRGEWTDAQAPDLVLKAKYGQLTEAWVARYGWPLHRPLRASDAHCLSALRQVIVNDQAAFDAQVQNLTKVLVDAINEEEIGKRLPTQVKDERGISKLQRFLDREGLPEVNTHIGLLRDLQALRSSGAAHLKGENFDKVAARLRLDEMGLPQAFDELLTRGIALVGWLRGWCETKPQP